MAELRSIVIVIQLHASKEIKASNFSQIADVLDLIISFALTPIRFQLEPYIFAYIYALTLMMTTELMQPNSNDLIDLFDRQFQS